jgi:ElaB/YqjD/DUF883 family membrane-anchored ribosome-binding protein
MSVPEPHRPETHRRCGAMTDDKNGSGEQPLAGLVDKAKEVAETVAEKAGPAMEKAKEVAGNVVEKAGPAMEKAKEVAGNVVEKAGPAMEKAKESATELVDKAKDFLGTKDEDTK